MNPWMAAPTPRSPQQQRLLVVDPSTDHTQILPATDLPGLLERGDVVVVNDAATLPASIPVVTPAGQPHELRLATSGGPTGWWAVLLGSGDWRTPTEDRPAPELVAPGDTLRLPDGSPVHIAELSPRSPALMRLRWDRPPAEILRLIYAHGRPVQYSYTGRDLQLADVQTSFAARPWAVEMPSASRPLHWAALEQLRRRGVGIATLTHAAGLSATGDDALDAQLPLPERYAVPSATIEAIERARAHGGRVLAVGTTVVRALEGNAAANHGRLVAGEGITSLIIRDGFVPQVVDGLLSGVHEPGTSHHRVIRAFAPQAVVRTATRRAARAGLLIHEFGDATLVLPRVLSRPARAA